MDVGAPERAAAAKAPGALEPRRVVLVAGGIVVLLVSTYLMLVWLGAQRLRVDARFLGAGVGELIRWGVWLGLVVVMVAGVAAGHVLEHARRARDAVDLRAAWSSAWASLPVVVALYASPLLFCVVYLLMGDPPRTVADFVLAFLLGFWWQAVLAALARPDTSAAPAPSPEGPLPPEEDRAEPEPEPEPSDERPWPPPGADPEQLPSWLRR